MLSNPSDPQKVVHRAIRTPLDDPAGEGGAYARKGVQFLEGGLVEADRVGRGRGRKMSCIGWRCSKARGQHRRASREALLLNGGEAGKKPRPQAVKPQA
jgi:hypothetical protein